MLSSGMMLSFSDLSLSKLSDKLTSLLVWCGKQVTALTPSEKCVIAGSGAFLSLVASHYVYERIYRKRHKYPDGVIGLPYVGCLLNVAYHGNDAFQTKVLPKYGPVSTYSVGNTRMVSLNDCDIFTEIFSKEFAKYRPLQMPRIFSYVNPQTGRALAPGVGFGDELWVQRRTLVHKAIQHIASVKYIEPQLVSLLNERLYPKLDGCARRDRGGDDAGGEALWHMRADLRNIAFNVVFGALFGVDSQLGAHDKRFETMSDAIRHFAITIAVALMPGLFYIPSIFGLRRYLSLKLEKNFGAEYAKVVNVLETQFVKQAEKAFEEKNSSVGNGGGSPQTTLFEEMYKRIQKHNEESADGKHQRITHDMLVSDLVALLLGSTETSATTMEAVMFYLVIHSELQDTIYEELIQHSSLNQDTKKMEFDYSHQSQCKQLNAFIDETMRISVVVPKAGPHSVLEPCLLKYNYDKQKKRCVDISFEPIGAESKKEASENDKGERAEFEYIIDESMLIEPNLLYILRDDNRLWGKNPGAFDMNRFYDATTDSKGEKKKSKRKNKRRPKPYDFAFGVGPRKCPGKLIAFKEIRIVLANLILNYTFEFESNKGIKDVEYDYALSRPIANAVPLIVKKRSQYVI